MSLIKLSKTLNYHHLLWLAFLACFALGQLLRIKVGSIAFNLLDVVIFIWLTIWVTTHHVQLISQLKKIWLNLRFAPTVYLLIIWIGLGWLINAFSNFSVVEGVIYSARLLLYLAFGVMIHSLIKQSVSFFNPLQIRKALIVTLLIIALAGLIQYLFLPDTRWLSILGWDDHFFRLISTFLDPNFSGIVMLVGFVWWQSPQFKTGNFPQLKTLISILFLLAISLTFSRSSYLALITGLGLLILINKTNWQKFVLYGLVFGLMWLFSPKPGGEGVNLTRTASLTARQSTLSLQLASLTSYQWLIGRGFLVPFQPAITSLQNFSLDQHARQADNLLVTLITGTGLIGLMLALKVSWQGQKFIYERDRYLWVSLICLLIHSQFNASFFYPHLFLLTILGVSSIKT